MDTRVRARGATAHGCVLQDGLLRVPATAIPVEVGSTVEVVVDTVDAVRHRFSLLLPDDYKIRDAKPLASPGAGAGAGAGAGGGAGAGAGKGTGRGKFKGERHRREQGPSAGKRERGGRSNNQRGSRKRRRGTQATTRGGGNSKRQRKSA